MSPYGLKINILSKKGFVKMENKNPVVTIEMENGGTIKVELYPEYAPNTVNNFISLVSKGFYDGIIFHRVIKGFKAGIILEIIYGIFIFFVCFVFARPLMKLFTSDTEVIRHGVIYLKLISIMYILPAITNGIQGYFRGIGDLKITLLSSFINMGVRVLAAIPLVFALGMGIEALPFSYLAGWIGMLIAEVPLLVKNYRAYIKSIR